MDYLICGCGKKIPKRWLSEGKYNKVDNNKYCVNCASESQYNLLLERFKIFMQNKRGIS